MNKKIVLSDERRKEIYYFRKKRREERDNPKPIETDPRKIEVNKMVDEMMLRAMPSFHKWREAAQEAADSVWFAYSELERIKEHIETVHKNDSTSCEEGCLEDFTLEDAKDYATNILKTITDVTGVNEQNSEDYAHIRDLVASMCFDKKDN